MLTKLRHLRSAARSRPGALQVPTTPAVHALLAKMGERWSCDAENAADRIIMLAITGWRPQYGDVIERLSKFVPGADEVFWRTCLMLRAHFESAESHLGETVTERDRAAWLEMLLETLKTLRREQQPARLPELLADTGVCADVLL